MECLGIVGVYMCGVPRDCRCVHVWMVGMQLCGVHREGVYMCGVPSDCGCVHVWSAVPRDCGCVDVWSA